MAFDFSTGIDIGGVQCIDCSTEEVFDQFDTCATRTFKCAWADRFKLINSLNPQGTSIGGIYILTSSPYPDSPNLFPQRFRTKGEGAMYKAANGMVAYDTAVVTAEYRPFRGGDPMGYVEFDLGCDVITMPGSGTWLETAELQDYTNPDGSSGGQKYVEVPLQDCARGYPVPVIGVVRRRSNVAGLDVTKFSDVAKAPLNSTPFYGFPPGTVLFEGVRARRQTLSNVGTGTGGNGPGNTLTTNTGNLLDGAWDIECRFRARPALQWDYLPFRMKVGNIWQFVLKKVRLKNNAGPYLGRSDLNALFT